MRVRIGGSPAAGRLEVDSTGARVAVAVAVAEGDHRWTGAAADATGTVGEGIIRLRGPQGRVVLRAEPGRDPSLSAEVAALVDAGVALRPTRGVRITTLALWTLGLPLTAIALVAFDLGALAAGDGARALVDDRGAVGILLVPLLIVPLVAFLYLWPGMAVLGGFVHDLRARGRALGVTEVVREAGASPLRLFGSWWPWHRIPVGLSAAAGFAGARPDGGSTVAVRTTILGLYVAYLLVLAVIHRRRLAGGVERRPPDQGPPWLPAAALGALVGPLLVLLAVT